LTIGVAYGEVNGYWVWFRWGCNIVGRRIVILGRHGRRRREREEVMFVVVVGAT